jgi:hypothetical protein
MTSGERVAIEVFILLTKPQNKRRVSIGENAKKNDLNNF